MSNQSRFISICKKYNGQAINFDYYYEVRNGGILQRSYTFKYVYLTYQNNVASAKITYTKYIHVQAADVDNPNPLVTHNWLNIGIIQNDILEMLGENDEHDLNTPEARNLINNEIKDWFRDLCYQTFQLSSGKLNRARQAATVTEYLKDPVTVLFQTLYQSRLSEIENKIKSTSTQKNIEGSTTPAILQSSLKAMKLPDDANITNVELNGSFRITYK